MADKFLDFNGLSRYTSKIVERFKSFVPTSRTVNGKSLSDDIKLTAADVGAQACGSYALASQLSSYVPTSRTINDKPLTDNIKLTASDIGVTQVDTSGFVEKSANAIAIGSNANNAGSYSIAIGRNATAGHSQCIAIGNNATTGTTGSGTISIAIGNNATATDHAGLAIGNGSQCIAQYSIAIGDRSNIPSSSHTAIALGTCANVENDCGIAIGFMATVTANYSVCLGYNARATGANTIQLGDANIAKLQCKVTVSTTSDSRDKTDITPINDGAVKFLKRIQAIRYKFNARSLYIDEEDNLSDKDKSDLHTYGLCSYDKEAHARGDKKGERVRVGVLAQEVQQALEDVYGDSSYGNLVDDNFYDLETKPTDVENQLTITYSNFIPFLIKAIQEQQDQIDQLKQENEYIKSKLI